MVPVGPKDRVNVEDLGMGFYRVVGFYGFMEKPDVPHVMSLAAGLGLATHPHDTTYFLGRETLVATGNSTMSQWRKTLFAFMSRNAQTAPSYFGIPLDRVIEIGVQVQL